MMKSQSIKSQNKNAQCQDIKDEKDSQSQSQSQNIDKNSQCIVSQSQIVNHSQFRTCQSIKGHTQYIKD